jgi:hypothetical protein
MCTNLLLLLIKRKSKILRNRGYQAATKIITFLIVT